MLADDEQFGLGYPVSTKQLTGKKSFHSIPNSEHKRLRRLTTAPINGHEALAMYIEYIEDIVVHSLDEWASMKEPIEFLKEMRKVAFKVITHIFLGSSAESVLGTVEKHYTDLNFGLKSAAINIPGFAFYKALKVRDLTSVVLVSCFYHLNQILGGNRQMMKFFIYQARNSLIDILQGVLDKRREKSTENIDPNEKRGMIDLLMEIEDEHGGKLQDEDIIDLLLMFLLAGHESSAHAAMWAIIYLHDHPELLQKAKEEQEEIIKKRPSTQKGLTLKDIREMDYLQKVLVLKLF